MMLAMELVWKWAPKKILIICLPFLFAVESGRASVCSDALEITSPRSNSNQLVSYLEKLNELDIVDANDIRNFMLDLQTGKISNPMSMKSLTYNSAKLVHYERLQEMISLPLEEKYIVEWARSYLDSRASAKVQRTQTEKSTREIYPFREMAWNFVKGGKITFARPIPKPAGEIELEHNFEMLDAPVTQGQWYFLMRRNPVDSNPSVQYETDTFTNNAVEMFNDGPAQRVDPDYPVTHITFWSAIVFANRLSESQKLQPAYDLSKVDFIQSTSAARGDLMARDGSRLSMNSASGNIYDVEGYRVPAQAEWEYVANGSGLTPMLLTPYNTSPGYTTKFGGTAWLSHTRPERIATRSPISFQDQDYYDLYGNVSEFIFGDNRKIYPVDHGESGLGVYTHSTWVHERGASYSDHEMHLDPWDRSISTRSNDLKSDRGLRLVRTIK